MNVFRCIFYTKSFQIVSGPCAFISQMMSLCRVFTYEYMYVHWLYVYIDNTMHLCIWKVNCVHSVIYIYVDMSSWMCVWWFMIRAVVCVYQNATFMWSLFIDAEPVDRKYFNMFFFTSVLRSRSLISMKCCFIKYISLSIQEFSARPFLIIWADVFKQVLCGRIYLLSMQ